MIIQHLSRSIGRFNRLSFRSLDDFMGRSGTFLLPVRVPQSSLLGLQGFAKQKELPVTEKKTKVKAKKVKKEEKEKEKEKEKVEDEEEMSEEERMEKKLVKKADSFVREKWHLRQKSNVPSNEESKNAKFKKMTVDKTVYDYVVKHNLAKLRKPRRGPRKERRTDIIPTTTETVADKIWKLPFKFKYAAATAESFPPPALPEIAFIGRSNVGKSSLINALVGNTALARTSPKPGLTQTINWFQSGPRIAVVDLPGYGFAFAKEEKKISWNEMMKIYLKERPNLKRIILIIDARHGFKASDFQIMEEILTNSIAKFQIVLTKVDALQPQEVAKRWMIVKQELSKFKNYVKRIMMVSSRTGAGVSLLRTELLGLFENVNLSEFQESEEKESPQKKELEKKGQIIRKAKNFGERLRRAKIKPRAQNRKAREMTKGPE